MQELEILEEITPEIKERIENGGFTRAELAELEDWDHQESRVEEVTWIFSNN